MTYTVGSISAAFDIDGNRLVGAIINGNQFISGWFQLDIQVEEGYVDFWQGEDNYRMTLPAIVDGETIPNDSAALLEVLAPFSSMGDEGEDVDWGAVSGNIFKNKHLTKNFIVANTNWKGYDGVDMKNTWKEIILSYPRTLPKVDRTIIKGESTWRPYGMYFSDMWNIDNKNNTSIGISLYGSQQNQVYVNGVLQSSPQVDMRNTYGDYIIIRPKTITFGDPDGNEVVLTKDTIKSNQWGSITGRIDDQLDLIERMNFYFLQCVKTVTAGTNVTITDSDGYKNYIVSVTKLANTAKYGFYQAPINQDEWRYHMNTVDTSYISFRAGNIVKQVIEQDGEFIDLCPKNGYVFLQTGSTTPKQAMLSTSQLQSNNTAQAILLRDLDPSNFHLNSTSGLIELAGVSTLVETDNTLVGDGTQANKLGLNKITLTTGTGSYGWDFCGNTSSYVSTDLRVKSQYATIRIGSGVSSTPQAFISIGPSTQSGDTLYTHERLLSNDSVLQSTSYVPACVDFLNDDFWLPYTTGNTSKKIRLNGANWKVKDIAAGSNINIINNNGTYTITGQVGRSAAITVAYGALLAGDMDTLTIANTGAVSIAVNSRILGVTGLKNGNDGFIVANIKGGVGADAKVTGPVIIEIWNIAAVDCPSVSVIISFHPDD